MNRAAAAGLHFAKHGAPPRASMQMQLWANPEISIGRLNEEHKTELLTWMNDQLKGTQLHIGKFTAAATSVTHTSIPIAILATDITIVEEDIRKSGIQLGSDEILQPANSMANEIAEVAGGEGALEVLDTLVTSVPFLGLLFKGMKAAGLTTLIIMTAWERSKSKNQLETSCSVIEQVGLEAVISCDDKDIADKGADLATALVGMAGAATTVGGLISLPISATKFVVKLVLLIRERLAIDAANQTISAGKINDDLLKKHPVLGLTLPHLSGINAFCMLVLPPGYTNEHSGLKRLKLEAKKLGNSWMRETLNNLDPFDKDFVNSRWVEDFNRVARLLTRTNYYLYDEKWLLHQYDAKTKEWTLVYEAPPITIFQQLKKYLKGKALAAKDTLKDVWQKIKENGGDLATLIKDKTLSVFRSIRDLFPSDKDIGTSEQKTPGPVETMITTAESEPAEEVVDQDILTLKRFVRGVHDAVVVVDITDEEITPAQGLPSVSNPDDSGDAGFDDDVKANGGNSEN